MTVHRAGRGRPRSSRRGEFTSWVSVQGRFTLADVAGRFGVDVGMANDLVKRAVRAREVHVTLDTARTAAKRPVAVYAAGAPSPVVPLSDVLRRWVL